MYFLRILPKWSTAARLVEALKGPEEEAAEVLGPSLVDEVGLSLFALEDPSLEAQQVVAVAFAADPRRSRQHTAWITIESAELQSVGLYPLPDHSCYCPLLSKRHHQTQSTDIEIATRLAGQIISRLRHTNPPYQRVTKTEAPQLFARFDQEGKLSAEDVAAAADWVMTGL